MLFGRDKKRIAELEAEVERQSHKAEFWKTQYETIASTENLSVLNEYHLLHSLVRERGEDGSLGRRVVTPVAYRLEAIARKHMGFKPRETTPNL